MAYGSALMRRLKELRQLRGLAPEKLAKKMGLSRATWFNKQNGTFEITVEEAELAARVLNVKFQVILDGKDVLSGVPASVSSHEETDTMNEQVATLIGLMNQLDEGQQEKVLRVVESTMSAMGFGGPGVARGPRRVRGKANSGPRT